MPDLRRLPEFLAARAVDAGALRGSLDYARFIVLGWYRTGSNLLLSLLNSDSAVCAYSEVLSPRGVFWGNRAYAPVVSHEAARRERDADVPGFLRRRVFRPHPHRVRAVGFKLFYPQLALKPPTGLVQALVADRDLRVIHLRRRNLLSVLVSTRIAKITGQMAATSREHAKRTLESVPPIVIPVSEAERFFVGVTQLGAECADVLRDHDVIDIDYDALCTDRAAQVNRVRAGLGLPARATSTRLVRQIHRPIGEVVANIDELRRAFDGTPWERFVA